MTRSELHTSPGYNFEQEFDNWLKQQESRKESFAWLSYALGLQAATQWSSRLELAAQNDVVRRRMHAGMQNAHAQPAPKPRRAITNSQSPRLTRHYKWNT